jgi:endogenous inhibitor of DNA gyrase (YacG/DUF329 family)
MADLGRWLAGEYRAPAEGDPDLPDPEDAEPDNRDH